MCTYLVLIVLLTTVGQQGPALGHCAPCAGRGQRLRPSAYVSIFAAVQPPSRRLRTCGRLHVSVVRLRRPRRWAGSLDPRNHHSVSARVHFAVQTDRTDDGCVLAAIVKQRAGPRLVRAANRLSHVEPRISLRLGKMWSRKKKRCVLGQVRNKKRPTPNCSDRR